MGEIVKALFNKVRYVNDQGKKSKAYKNIDETFNIYEGEGEYFVVNDNTGAINKDGKEIIKPKEGNKLMLFNDYIVVRNSKNAGNKDSVRIVDIYGTIIATYDDISKSIDGEHYSVVKDGKYGLLDGSAKIVFECKYKEKVKPLGDDLFDVDGKTRFSPDFKFSKFSYIGDSKYIKIEANQKMGLLDTDLNVILPVKYESIVIGYDNIIQAELNGKISCYNLKGELLVDYRLGIDSAESTFSELKQDSEYGL